MITREINGFAFSDVHAQRAQSTVAIPMTAARTPPRANAGMQRGDSQDSMDLQGDVIRKKWQIRRLERRVIGLKVFVKRKKERRHKTRDKFLAGVSGSQWCGREGHIWKQCYDWSEV